MATWQDFAGSYGDIAGGIGKLSGVHNSKLYDTMANQIAKAIGFTGKTWVPGTYQFENSNEGGTFMETAQGKQASPEFLKALEAYQFSRDADKLKGTISQNGQTVGNFTAGNKDTGFDKVAQTAIPVGLGLLAGGAAMGAFGPGGAAAGAGGASGGAGGLIGAGEGAAQLAAYTAANPLTAAQVTAAALPAGGLPGLGAAGGFLAGEGAAQLAAYTAANPVTAAQIAATVPASGLQGLGTAGFLAGEGAAQLGAYTSANPLTASQVTASTLPAGGLPGLGAATSAAPAVFNAAADSQLASSQLGITGAQSAAAATAPATVNLVNAGGTMGTAGGLSGLLAGVKQQATDAISGSVIGDAAAWMKQNPTLGRLLLSGASGLLSSAGSSGGSSASTQAQAPINPVKWNSPIQQGLLAPVQQYAPPAVQNRPAGLLAQGFQNDGAWRYMGG